ncbi:hypothetical protein J4474_00495 [Candidatus Pacearchaeota archaeon]|nr:hypothetical protein [Candidatus Pacearchaeota archaeon]
MEGEDNNHSERHDNHESHEHHSVHSSSVKTLTNRLRENPWIIATFVLGIAVLVTLVPLLGISGNEVSGKTAGDNLVSYLNTVADSEVTFVNVTPKSGLYEVTVLYKEQNIPVYVTKDGQSYTSSLIPLLSEVGTPTDVKPTEVPKTDKPSVELYVFTYCPYGLQMEKAFDPVVKLFGSKIDYKIRQIGAMHDSAGCSGSACFEKTEAQRQLCIEKNYPDKYLNYVNAFAIDTVIGSCSGTATCVDPLIESLMTKLGIDKAKINSCMATEGITMYDAEVKNAGAKGAQGSPTVIINGVDASLSRSPEAVKTAICAAFTTPPAECSQALSTAQASPGFGGITGAATASTGAQC